MNVGRRLSLTVLATLATLPTTLNAQRGPTTITPRFVNTNVRTVIDTLSQILGIDVLIEDTVQGRITLVSEVPLTPDQFRTAVIDRLRDSGYEVTEEDGLLRIGSMETPPDALLLGAAGRLGR